MRREQGAIFPLAVFLIVVAVAFLALTIDVMRSAYTVGQLRFAAQSAALAAYSRQVVTPEEFYNGALARQHIIDALAKINGDLGEAPWHSALKGPDSTGESVSAVRFDADKVEFPVNLQDDQEFFVRLKVKRNGTDALQNLFMPLVFAFGGGDSSVLTTDPQFSVDVVGQPATRIGKGVDRLTSDLSEQSKIGFAAFPVAISNQQFAAIAASSAPQSTYVLDLVKNTSDAVPAGHIKAGLVNLKSGNSIDYYADVQGEIAVSDLVSQINYFVPQATPQLPPQAVERGAYLGVIKPSGSAYDNQLSRLSAAFGAIKLRPYTYMLPVIKGDPAIGVGPAARNAANEVAGFALLQITDVVVNPSAQAGPAISITVKLAPSTVMPNCCVDAKSLSLQSKSAAPAQIAPFGSRTFSAPGALSRRANALVLAPALAPYQRF